MTFSRSKIEYKRGILQAAIAYAFAKYYYNDGRMNLALSTYELGRYEVATVLGGSAFGSAVISDTLQSGMMPMNSVGKKQKYRKSDTAALGAFIQAASYIGIIQLLAPGVVREIGLPMLAGQAIGSDMVAEYAANILMI